MKFFKKHESDPNALKLNYSRTCIIGFAFFGILLLWQVYDSWCPTFLAELFKETFHKSSVEDVQYMVGCMMALDNLAALIMLPIFGHLSDKTHTKLGKRMPYILIGTFVCAVAFPFIPVAFHFHNLIGTIALMAIVLFFAMMYRNPAVALMPDITPKPLRSKANGVINIMGYIGGACATIVGMIFVTTSYLGKDSVNWLTNEGNIWIIEAPFLIASVLMIISALVLAFRIKENKLAEEIELDMQRGEQAAETVDAISDEGPMSKNNKIMLALILCAEFFWFMADNGIATFMGNYTIYHLGCKSSATMYAILAGGFASVIGFAFGGVIASKIGRKWTVFTGIGIAVFGLALWAILSTVVSVPTKPAEGFNSFPWYIYIVWVLKGFGLSLVHVNSYPMVVELCTNKKVGKFTGFYYAASMGAQTITPIALGSLMLVPNFGFDLLPWYGFILMTISGIIFFFVKNVKTKKTEFKVGLEALDVDD